jgi:hypothetical protein
VRLVSGGNPMRQLQFGNTGNFREVVRWRRVGRAKDARLPVERIDELRQLPLRLLGVDRAEHHGVRDFAAPDLQPTSEGAQKPGGIARIFGLMLERLSFDMGFPTAIEAHLKG